MIFHTGAPKCGSSSIQSILCETPEFTSRSGQKYAYFAIGRSGDILSPANIIKAYKTSTVGFISSAPYTQIGAKFKTSLQKILKICPQDVIPILSSEGWSAEILENSIGTLFEDLNVLVDVIFVFRPPILWMNSSWWQWGAFSDSTLPQWVRSQMHAVSFSLQLRKWNELPNVRKIHAGCLKFGPADILNDALDVELETNRVSNVGSSGPMLDFLIRNKEYFGRKPHKPEIEFQLNSALNKSGGKPPFVITPQLQHLIFDSTIDSMKALGRFFANKKSLEVYLSDPEFFDRDHFLQRTVSPPKDFTTEKERNEFEILLAESLIAAKGLA